MTQLLANGHLYSDDGSTARDMNGGGYKEFLLPMLADVMVEVDGVAGAADSAEADAEAAAASAAAAAASAATLYGSSTTSVTVGAGSKSWTTQAGKQFGVGQFLRIQRQADANVYMYGRSTAYDSTTGALIVNVERIAGAGAFTDWDIFVTGVAGDMGPAGAAATGVRAIAGADTVIASDNLKLLRCTGTFTLGATASATLGATFSFIVENSGTGLITFDPASAETVNGASTLVIQPGASYWLFNTGAGTWFAILLAAGRGGVFHLRYQLASGAAGASAAAGFSTVDVNTTVINTLPGANISSGIISIPAGTYEVEGDAVFTGKSRVILAANSGLATIIAGLSCASMPKLRGTITITSATSYLFRLFNASGGTLNIGAPISDGDPEIYGDIIFKKVA
jgi:hypothetical protein